jgi:hypothetical protein
MSGFAVQMMASAANVIPPYWANTSLLLHFDGTEGQTTTVDSSQYAHAVSLTDCALTTSAPVYGTAKLDVTNGLATILTHISVVFGTDDFTIEGFFQASGETANAGMVSFGPDDISVPAPVLFMDSAEKLRFRTGGNTRISGTTSVPIDGALHHIAICRVSGFTKLFLAGTQEGSTYTDPNDYTCPTSIIIGETATGSLHGFWDEIRIIKGVGLYSANFTPPVPPFPNGPQ